ncbi:MAG: DNA sulfur modification protein DndD [Nitrosopumilus sp.]|nr:DNA sulfur modification protein DndD [Nitrosopumilus sp.]
MHLTKVTLKNYGVYRDKVEFDLTTSAEKPVVLIGGTNGAGKTTLFESILIGFYGQSYFDKKTSRKDYEKFLGNKIHRYLGTTAAADSTSIVIDFKFFHNGQVDDYTVDRTWHNDDGRILEELKIKKNGKRLDSVEESQWQSFIEELIPKGIAKLFFFDGEKIVRMAEDEHDEIEIKSSFDSLLGLDIIEQLHNDLRIHIMRNMNDDAKTIQIEHDQNVQRRDEHLEETARLQQKIVDKNEVLDSISNEIATLEAKISKIGGGFASKREDLKAKKAFLEMKRSSLENDLRALLSGPLPFTLIPKQIKSLKSQMKKDEQVIKNQFEKEILNEKLKEITDILNSKALWRGISDESKIKETLFSKLSTVFDSKNLSKGDMVSMFNFSTLETSNIMNLLENLHSIYVSQLKNGSIEFQNVVDELDQVDVALVNAPNDDEIGPLVSKLNKLHEEQGVLKNEIEHLDTQMMSKNYELKMINVKIRNAISNTYKNKNAGTQAELAAKVQKVLDEYTIKIKEKKLQLLEGYLLEELQRLLHKENLITKVTVDSESFEITLYDKDGNPIPKDLLSKGEQQMFATGVLLALAKTSGKPLPFMIDTPLARLDMSHRDNMIEKFFPYASHQVVIFSTDSEIDEHYYSKMKPYISRSYAMEYLPGKGKTRQHSEYFWDENGVKKIAV